MNYNKTENYTKSIKPIVERLVKECRENRIPCFMSFATENNDEEKKTVYETEMVSANSIGEDLCEDKIADYLNVNNGFVTVPFHNDTIVSNDDSDWMDADLV